MNSRGMSLTHFLSRVVDVAAGMAAALLQTPLLLPLLLLLAVPELRLLLPGPVAVVVLVPPRISGLLTGMAPGPCMPRSPRRVSISCAREWTTSIRPTAAGETSAAGPTLLSG